MKFTSRKFLIALVGIVAGCALQWFGKLDTTTASLIGGIVSGYLAANVGQRAVTQ